MRYRTRMLVFMSAKALHSELLTEVSSRFSSRNESERVESQRILPKYFWISENSNSRNSRKQKSWKIAIFAIFASSETFEKHGNYRNISEIWKTAISETRKNKNFGKKRLTQGLNVSPSISQSCSINIRVLIFSKFLLMKNQVYQ